MRNYRTPHIIKENYENLLIHRCNYIQLSQVYCVWQVVKTPTIIFNNPVFIYYNDLSLCDTTQYHALSVKLYNTNQQTAPLLNKYFNFHIVFYTFETRLPEDEPTGSKRVKRRRKN